MTFFHKTMIQHRRKNQILALKSQEGHLIHSQEELETELNHYFKSLLKEPRNDQDREIKKNTKNIPKILMEDHNKMLLSKVSIQEVEDVVMGMPNGKAPGLDGFTIGCYKSCCPIINLEVHALVEESKIQKFVLKALKSNFLTKISKGISIDSLDKFRPIAIYNAINKIISKVLAN